MPTSLMYWGQNVHRATLYKALNEWVLWDIFLSHPGHPWETLHLFLQIRVKLVAWFRCEGLLHRNMDWKWYFHVILANWLSVYLQLRTLRGSMLMFCWWPDAHSIQPALNNGQFYWNRALIKNQLIDVDEDIAMVREAQTLVLGVLRVSRRPKMK